MRLLFVLFLLLFGFSKCKKESKLDRPLNVTLYDKAPKVIYSYIKGKWKFIYGKGGFIGNQMYYCDGCTVEFTSDGKIITNTFFNANAVIDWQKEEGKSTYVMHFQDDTNSPVSFVVDRIVNDTLVLRDYASDAIFYHFIKL